MAVDGVARAYDAIDAVELMALHTENERQILDQAERLVAARKTVACARIDATNAQLPEAVARWRVTEAAASAAAGVVESALGALLATVMQLAHAQKAEQAAARSVNRLAASAGDSVIEDINGADRLRHVVTMVGREGVTATADRPDLGLFGDDEKPNFTQIGTVLAEAYRDPERAARQLQDTQLGEAAGL